MRFKFPTWVALLLSASLIFPSSAWSLSLQKKKDLGRKMLQTIRKHFRLVDDEEVAGYVQSVGQRIISSLGPVHYQYRFFVIDDSTPNAFAVPGGYIFLFRGIIEIMDSEAELASIICHEVAHVEARHIEKRIEKQRLLSIAAIVGTLAGAFLGLNTDASRALTTGVMAGIKSLELKYSRDNEEEADRLGFKYLCASGYDPWAMVTIMRKMRREGWRSDSRVPSYLKTHPALAERVGYLEALARNYSEKNKTCTLRDPMGDFPLVQAILMSRHTDPELARTKFKGWLHDKDHRLGALFGLGRLAMEEGNMQEALHYMEQAAMLKPRSPVILSALGELYRKMGKLDQAERTLRAVLRLDPDSSVAHLRLGLVLEEQHRWEQAFHHLKKAESLAPYNPQLDYHLGVLYGRMNRLGPAHYFLGRYYQRQGNRKLAIFHYTKAKTYLAASDERYKEIEDILKEMQDASSRT